MKNDIRDSGAVFIWKKTFEVGQNKELAGIHPDCADFFNDLNNRIYDLGDFSIMAGTFNQGLKTVGR